MVKDKLDKFHYHEALHSAFSMCEIIDLTLCQHKVYETAPEEIKQIVTEAQEKIHQYYVWCCEQQDKLED